MTEHSPVAATAAASTDAFTTAFVDRAPCGLLRLDADGRVLRANATLLDWLGRRRHEVEQRVRFADLLSAGERIHYETHVAPMLLGNGRVDGIAAELRAADGNRRAVLVTAVAEGDDPGHVAVVVYDARLRRAYEDELLRARREADRERARIQTLATTLQQTLLPPALPVVPGLECAAAYHSASPDQVGGDFYDLFPLAGGRWGLFLGDVCGKGPEAAVLTSLARYTLRAAAAQDPDPLTGLATLHSVLMQNGDRSMLPRFCTAMNATLTRVGDGVTVELGTGGHPAPLLVRADGTTMFAEIAHGQIVGILTDPTFSRATILLRPGDTLLLYTDGVTEARLPRPPARGDGTDRVDEEGLLELVSGFGPIGAAALVRAVARFVEGLGEGVEDDVAILALSVPPTAAATPATKARGR